jgi:hypothetical protein
VAGRVVSVYCILTFPNLGSPSGDAGFGSFPFKEQEVLAIRKEDINKVLINR